MCVIVFLIPQVRNKTPYREGDHYYKIERSKAKKVIDSLKIHLIRLENKANKLEAQNHLFMKLMRQQPNQIANILPNNNMNNDNLLTNKKYLPYIFNYPEAPDLPIVHKKTSLPHYYDPNAKVNLPKGLYKDFISKNYY